MLPPHPCSRYPSTTRLAPAPCCASHPPSASCTPPAHHTQPRSVLSPTPRAHASRAASNRSVRSSASSRPHAPAARRRLRHLRRRALDIYPPLLRPRLRTHRHIRGVGGLSYPSSSQVPPWFLFAWSMHPTPATHVVASLNIGAPARTHPPVLAIIYVHLVVTLRALLFALV